MASANGSRSRSSTVLRVSAPWRAHLPDAQAVRSLTLRAGPPVHESARSQLAEVLFDGVVLIVKRSRRQESSRWLQLTGWWRDGEGVRTFDRMADLMADGMPVPEPVAALDVRQGGQVVESWLVYRRIVGDDCTCDDAPDIARLLQRLHRHGWAHGDPHVRNFLRTRGGLVVLDCAAMRRRPSRWARALDVVLLEKCCPGGAVAYEGLDRQPVTRRLALAYSRVLVGWRRLKRRVRTLMGAAQP